MAKWYKLSVAVGPRRRTIVARSVAKRNGHLHVGIGMTARHRSCLVLLLQDSVCYIEGVSTFTRGFQERKNPLKLSGGHLSHWLTIANDIAYQNGCSTVELFDAANVCAPDSEMQFLSKLTLLETAEFAYEKYGYESTDPERASAIRRVADDLHAEGITPDMRTGDIDAAFEKRGFDTTAMQMTFTKTVQAPLTSIDVEDILYPRQWMKRYSDASLDVY